MATEIQAPHEFKQHLQESIVTIFAGGSIEMNTASQWQKCFVKYFKDNKNVVVLNPRRDSWDASWKQVKMNEHVRSMAAN